MYLAAHLAAMEGHLPCLKFLVSSEGCPEHTLGARNDHGETPRDLAQQFYKENILEYIDHVQHELDHPEEAESECLGFYNGYVCQREGVLEGVGVTLEGGGGGGGDLKVCNQFCKENNTSKV